jgi:predicted nuclease of restriction endonuclease-like (RecB) superfamily
VARKKSPERALARPKTRVSSTPPRRLVSDVRRLIEQSRQQVSQTVNAALVWLYWNIGKRIREDVLKKKRADYGKRIVSTLSRQLTEEFGRGFGKRNLLRMVRFAEVIDDPQIVSSLMAQLSWTHLIHIIAIDDPLQRDFYTEMCRAERWSVRTLQAKMQGMLYERTSISKKPDKLIRQELAELREEDRLSPDLVFRDPYVLDFLGLRDTFSERDLEEAILRDLEAFLLELGVGFAFVTRQKRIVIGGEDHYIDLLFYHRGLRRLVAIDLKLGKFRAADKGQMELYLRWLEEHEMQAAEEPPLGLILCADKSEEHVQLLRLDESGIRVARYLTELPPRQVLAKKLHEAILLARQRLEARSEAPPAT